METVVSAVSQNQRKIIEKFKENCKKEKKEVKRKTDTVGTHTLFKYWYSGDLPFRF